jgi:hypothetical protein
MGARGQKPRMTDAVIVVPGIMGSELVNAKGTVVWGMSGRVLGKAWLNGKMDALRVTEDELAGNSRLRATRLLRVPAFMPILRGIEPYSLLLDRLADLTVDPRAIAEFPYDWRLSIEHNAGLLVKRCHSHLDAWRALVVSRKYGDPDEVRIVIVAHSMGGLVAQFATELLSARPLVRRIITLGTPFFGSINAVQMLATGTGAPIPKRAGRALAVTCPGVYDLLPRYKCVTQVAPTGPDSNLELVSTRLLTPDDIASIGANLQFANEAHERHARLASTFTGTHAIPVSTLVGADQPTLQSLTLDAGACDFHSSLLGVDHSGDGTVYRQAAAPVGVVSFPLPQRHGTLAKTAEAITFVRDKLLGADTGPPLGTRPIGLDLPSEISVGQVLEVKVSGTDDPVGVGVTTIDVDTGVRTKWAPGVRQDGHLMFTRAGLPAGLHRVEVKAGGFSAVSELLLVWGGA